LKPPTSISRGGSLTPNAIAPSVPSKIPTLANKEGNRSSIGAGIPITLKNQSQSAKPSTVGPLNNAKASSGFKLSSLLMTPVDSITPEQQAQAKARELHKQKMLEEAAAAKEESRDTVGELVHDEPDDSSHAIK